MLPLRPSSAIARRVTSGKCGPRADPARGAAPVAVNPSPPPARRAIFPPTFALSHSRTFALPLSHVPQYLHDLNPEQRQAALATEGPVLVRRALPVAFGRAGMA